MKFQSNQEVTLKSACFNYVRSIGCIGEPPAFGKAYKVANYWSETWHGRPVFTLVDFPTGLKFFEETFDALPSLDDIVRDLNGDISLINRKKI